jgi:hypothetical protein
VFLLSFVAVKLPSLGAKVVMHGLCHGQLAANCMHTHTHRCTSTAQHMYLLHCLYYPAQILIQALALSPCFQAINATCACMPPTKLTPCAMKQQNPVLLCAQACLSLSLFCARLHQTFLASSTTLPHAHVSHCVLRKLRRPILELIRLRERLGIHAR